MRRALLLTCVALGAAAGLQAQQVTARVGSELSAANYYAPVTVPITVDMSASGGALLGSYTARLTWNPNGLVYNGYISNGSQDSSAQGNFPPPAMNADSAYYGVLKFTAVSPSGVGGLVTIAQLRFYAGSDTLPSPVTLSFNEMSAAVTFTDLLPILAVQGATYCRSLGLWGDLDHDQAANSRDALIVLSEVVGLPVNPLVADTALADVDEDGRTTSRDALIILSFAVGMPVQGQRVLLPAAAPACATGSARQLAIQPGTIDIAVGQPFRLLAQATDSAGRSVSLPPMTWRSSDYTVAGVDPTGLVTPRAAGTATITAEAGPGVTAAAMVMVLARRPNWYVDIAATGRPVQNGSATYPFETPQQAFPVASEGDTVRVAPGSYAWNDDGRLDRGLVIQGGTPGDTTTRPVFRGSDNYIAFWLQGGQRFELKNVVLQGFYEGIELDQTRNLVLEDVKLVQGQSNMDGIYACPSGAVDTVRIDRTEFLGNPLAQSAGDAIYFEGCSNITGKALILRDSRIRNMYDGVYVYGMDSLQILRSDISDNHGQAVYISQENNETPAVHIAQSRFERNRYGGITVYDARRIVIDTTVIRSDSSDALELYHNYGAGGATRLNSDSIYMAASGAFWLATQYADSVVAQDVAVRFPDDTVVGANGSINASTVVLRRIALANIGYYYYAALDVYANRLLADSVAVTACIVGGCGGAYGISFHGSGAQPMAQVLRSSFTGVDYPIQATGTGVVLDVGNVTADSVYIGVNAYSLDSIAVHGSTFTRVGYAGIQLNSVYGTRGPSLLSGNSVTCTPPTTYQYGAYINEAAAVVEFDTTTICDRGVEFYGAHPGSRARQSTFRSNNIGIAVTQYSPWDTVVIPIDSSAVSASNTAAVSLFGIVPFTHNRLENNLGDGLSVSSTFGTVMQAHDNAFVNNAGYALVSVGDTVDASSNWWGSPSQPPTSGPNAVLGRVSTLSPLASAPTNLPGLAPPLFTRLSGTPLRSSIAPDRPRPVPAIRTRPPQESFEVRMERDREARRAAKAAKDARHASHVNR